MVLSGMVKNGYISEEEMNEAYNEELNVIGKKSNINVLFHSGE